jgi:deazaflavin-dependent oxidoreductase (nitroreductase family)
VSRKGLKLVSSLHVALFRASGGRIGGRLRGNLPVLLLTTTGRKSGKQRTTPLLYVRDGEQYVIVASVGGAPKHPSWYLNLQNNPAAAIQIGARRIAVGARTATPDERTRLWSLATAMYPGYDAYQAKTSREIPVVVLTPSRPSARTDRPAE